MEGLEQKIKKVQMQSIIDWEQIQWDDLELWSCDGLAHQSKAQLLTKMNKTISITKELLTLENKINGHVSKMEKNLDECSKINQLAQQIFAEKSLQKKESKNEFEKALSRYISSIEEWNISLIGSKRAAAEKQKIEQLTKIIRSLKEYNQSLEECCSTLGTEMDHLKTKNDRFIERRWKNLISKWYEWDSQQLGIFVSYILKYSRNQIITLSGIAQRDKIDPKLLMQMTKNDWKDAFRLKDFNECCSVYNMFCEVCNEFPIDDIASEAQNIPREYLCPLSNTVMKDPVIARDGVTYDRDSIVSKAPKMCNPSLFENGDQSKLQENFHFICLIEIPLNLFFSVGLLFEFVSFQQLLHKNNVVFDIF
ncbi:hypothetical protein RFI_29480 [Reticulomyxa filosa]|uniref:U-box domain-containing protein n=1 Tax=Reticulomyxa filosa TaxID=46433 RepID=X6M367_RETFI|nr:hypothetical protein RFI_29480 [Reticulomyxa filosa]|eukprot:ETO07907.1 hypothetical protein RFI_29480 [Reticulomyxa filosa]